MSWQPNRRSDNTLQQRDCTVDNSQCGARRLEGTKLPTQRQLAMQFDVNRSTVQQALEELKAMGILEAKVGSGVYVTHNSGMH